MVLQYADAWRNIFISTRTIRDDWHPHGALYEMNRNDIPDEFKCLSNWLSINGFENVGSEKSLNYLRQCPMVKDLLTPDEQSPTQENVNSAYALMSLLEEFVNLPQTIHANEKNKTNSNTVKKNKTNTVKESRSKTCLSRRCSSKTKSKTDCKNCVGPNGDGNKCWRHK